MVVCAAVNAAMTLGDDFAGDAHGLVGLDGRRRDAVIVAGAVVQKDAHRCSLNEIYIMDLLRAFQHGACGVA